MYLNDGNGHFGAANQGQAGAGSSRHAHLFATATSDWRVAWVFQIEASSCSTSVWPTSRRCDGGVQDSNLGGIEFHLDGKIIDTTSSVRIVDADRDGLADIAFCNRNEIEEVAKHSRV
ncbi:MAG: hypothetical protein IPH13_00460 [Planctomycetes bacterium]|nr:hypothetical protein [Planctomycetota bacterium]